MNKEQVRASLRPESRELFDAVENWEDADVQIMREALLNMIVCVPAGMPDEEINRRVPPSGTSGGWQVTTDDDPKMQRVACDNNEATGREHVVLVC